MGLPLVSRFNAWRPASAAPFLARSRAVFDPPLNAGGGLIFAVTLVGSPFCRRSQVDCDRSVEPAAGGRGRLHALYIYVTRGIALLHLDHGPRFLDIDFSGLDFSGLDALKVAPIVAAVLFGRWARRRRPPGPEAGSGNRRRWLTRFSRRMPAESAGRRRNGSLGRRTLAGKPLAARRNTSKR